MCSVLGWSGSLILLRRIQARFWLVSFIVELEWSKQHFVANAWNWNNLLALPRWMLCVFTIYRIYVLIFRNEQFPWFRIWSKFDSYRIIESNVVVTLLCSCPHECLPLPTMQAAAQADRESKSFAPRDNTNLTRRLRVHRCNLLFLSQRRSCAHSC